jgi:hypothetical protein
VGTALADDLLVEHRGGIRVVTLNRRPPARRPARALQMTKRIFAKHLSLTAAAMIDFGLAAETVELGADEHIEQIRAFLGDDKYEALEVSDV